MTIFAALIIGGLYEEIVFRGYIQNVLEKRIFKRYSPIFSVLIKSLLFGLYHLQQDIFGIIAAVIGELYWSIYIKNMVIFGLSYFPMAYSIPLRLS